jgi:hypothetical protein
VIEQVWDALRLPLLWAAGYATGYLLNRPRKRPTGRDDTVAFLTRTDILEADDTRYETVQCPEWGGDVRLRSISGAKRDAYESSLMEERGGSRKMNLRNARAKLIVLTAVDEDGRPLFTSDDLRALGAKNAAPLDRLFDAARKLAGMSDDDIDKMTENFGETEDDAESSV